MKEYHPVSTEISVRKTWWTAASWEIPVPEAESRNMSCDPCGVETAVDNPNH